MRKIILFMMTTLDGFYEGPKQEIDWHNVDEEFNEFAIAQLNEVDTLLFGRKTYSMMASYWPTPQAKGDDQVVAAKMNATPKIVFSRTLAKPEWENTRLVKANFVEEVKKLKNLPGKDLIMFGSSDLGVTFLEKGLLDEIRVIINPLILGGGKALFSGIGNRLKLRLEKAKTFRSGNVLLYYVPAGK